MSITSAELARAGKAGLDFYLKNNPIDVAGMQRPLLKHLTAKKKTFGGAKEHIVVSTHSRPKAAGYSPPTAEMISNVSTHSRPKAAGRRCRAMLPAVARFNSQPPEGGWLAMSTFKDYIVQFQLTAARRRLVRRAWNGRMLFTRFNSQPPEGGWINQHANCIGHVSFNSQPPEGGWLNARHGGRV